MLYNKLMKKDFKLEAIYSEGNVLLSWNKIENVDGYRIFQKEESGVFGGFQTSKTEYAVIENVEKDKILEFKVKPFYNNLKV